MRQPQQLSLCISLSLSLHLSPVAYQLAIIFGFSTHQKYPK